MDPPPASPNTAASTIPHHLDESQSPIKRGGEIKTSHLHLNMEIKHWEGEKT